MSFSRLLSRHSWFAVLARFGFLFLESDERCRNTNGSGDVRLTPRSRGPHVISKGRNGVRGGTIANLPMLEKQSASSDMAKQANCWSWVQEKIGFVECAYI